MAVLKKINSSTLMEALVATVLIIVVFVIASLVLNNLLLNSFATTTHKINYRLNELEYNINCGKLVLPYSENFEGWDITIEKDKSEKSVGISAINQVGKEVLRKRIYEE